MSGGFDHTLIQLGVELLRVLRQMLPSAGSDNLPSNKDVSRTTETTRGYRLGPSFFAATGAAIAVTYGLAYWSLVAGVRAARDVEMIHLTESLVAAVERVLTVDPTRIDSVDAELEAVRALVAKGSALQQDPGTTARQVADFATELDFRARVTSEQASAFRDQLERTSERLSNELLEFQRSRPGVTQEKLSIRPPGGAGRPDVAPRDPDLIERYAWSQTFAETASKAALRAHELAGNAGRASDTKASASSRLRGAGRPPPLQALLDAANLEAKVLLENTTSLTLNRSEHAREEVAKSLVRTARYEGKEGYFFLYSAATDVEWCVTHGVDPTLEGQAFGNLGDAGREAIQRLTDAARRRGSDPGDHIVEYEFPKPDEVQNSSKMGCALQIWGPDASGQGRKPYKNWWLGTGYYPRFIWPWELPWQALGLPLPLLAYACAYSSQTRLRNRTFQSYPDGIVVTNMHDVIVRFNAAASRFLDLEAFTKNGGGFRTLVHPGYRTLYDSTVDGVKRGQTQPFRTLLLRGERKTPAYAEMILTPAPNKRGKQKIKELIHTIPAQVIKEADGDDPRMNNTMFHTHEAILLLAQLNGVEGARVEDQSRHMFVWNYREAVARVAEKHNGCLVEYVRHGPQSSCAVILISPLGDVPQSEHYCAGLTAALTLHEDIERGGVLSESFGGLQILLHRCFVSVTGREQSSTPPIISGPELDQSLGLLQQCAPRRVSISEPTLEGIGPPHKQTEGRRAYQLDQMRFLVSEPRQADDSPEIWKVEAEARS